jgi:2-keto-4-pentenoate hydratase/2-oxohepta-3-ene-1,7-dioic acid hydratase in catechol pathway
MDRKTGGSSSYRPMAKPVRPQQALEAWTEVEPALRAIIDFHETLDPAAIMAPLPRAWQWLDGSAFQSHGDLMDAVLGIAKPKTDLPLKYQGTSDKFYGPTDEVKFPDKALGIDFVGAFGLIGDAVPMVHGFQALVAHAARPRDLVTGTVIGSGTVSNANFAEIGSSCIAEQRGGEVIDLGIAQTEFIKFGDKVRTEAVDAHGRSPSCALEQKVVKA